MTKPSAAHKLQTVAAELREMAAALSDSDLEWNLQLAQEDGGEVGELAEIILTWEKAQRRKRGLQ